MEAPLYNMKGEKTGTVALPDAVFGLRWNAALVKQVIEAELANKRRNTVHTKNRGEVSGGGKKPWRQKGTGRARHGSIRSPIWIGGGVTHGPRNERVYDQKINKRMRRKALLVALSAKAENREIVVIDEFAFPEARTRHAALLFRALAAYGLSDIAKKKGSTLVTLPTHDVSVTRALRNVPHVVSCEARNSTAGMVLAAKYVIVPRASFFVFAALSKSKP